MFTNTNRNRIAGALALAVVVATAASARADDPAVNPAVDPDSGARRRTVRVQIAGPDRARWVDHIVVKTVQGDYQAAYWIGVHGAPVEGALKAHLNLDGGVLVDRVAPDSPAAAAGIQQHDVLLTFGETALGGVGELAEAVRSSEGDETDVTLLRGGQEVALKISPLKRPNEYRLRIAPGQPPDLSVVQQWLDQWRQGDGQLGDWQRSVDGPWNMLFMRPGIAFPGEMFRRSNIPNNTSISIHKAGDEPAKIVVQRGDETWQATEDDLQPLPEDVRPFVRRALGQTFGLEIVDRPLLRRPAAGPQGDAPVDGPQIRRRIEVRPALPPMIELREFRRLDNLPADRRRGDDNDQLRRLQQQLERLQRDVNKLLRQSDDS